MKTYVKLLDSPRPTDNNLATLSLVPRPRNEANTKIDMIVPSDMRMRSTIVLECSAWCSTHRGQGDDLYIKTECNCLSHSHTEFKNRLVSSGATK